MSPRPDTPAPGPRASVPQPTARPIGPRPGAAPPPTAELHQRLAAVLADLTFPALRWQAITVAEIYGCDGVTRTVLERLPDRSYLSLPELVTVLAAVLHGRPAPAAAGAPRSAPRVPAPTRTVAPTRTAIPAGTAAVRGPVRTPTRPAATRPRRASPAA